MSNSLLTYVVGVLVLWIIVTVTVLVHELGHLATARRIGVAVPLLQVGIGPLLLRIAGKRTVYELRLFPVLGLVLIPDDQKKLARGLAELRSFIGLPPAHPTIRKVSKRTPAEAQRRRAALLRVIMVARRRGNPAEFFARRSKWDQAKVMIGGVAVNVPIAVIFLFLALSSGPNGLSANALTDTATLLGKGTLDSLRELSKFATLRSDPAEASIGASLNFWVNIIGNICNPRLLVMVIGAINLMTALFNLIPIKPLDGGHLAVITIEAICQRDVSPLVEAILTLLGILFTIWMLILPMVYQLLLK